jgi:hypothetical protein
MDQRERIRRLELQTEERYSLQSSPNTRIRPIKSSYFTTDGLSVSMSWCREQCGTCYLILLPVWTLLSEICGTVSVGRPLWREGGSAVCSEITQWFGSCRTLNHTLLSHLKLLQPEGPGSRIYIPQEQGGPIIPLDTGFPLRLAGLRWRYFNPFPQGTEICNKHADQMHSQFQSQHVKE